MQVEALELREPTGADATALGDLLHRCNSTYRSWAPRGWQPPPAASEREGWRRRFAVGGHWARIVCDPDGVAIAVVAWTDARERDYDGTRPLRTAHISSLFVDPSFWRRGLATRLLRKAEESMRARGYRYAELWTPEQADARRFYEACGWHHDGRQRWFPDLALPLVGYAKSL
jgi:GNAT superfamily N-acetyltransferase